MKALDGVQQHRLLEGLLSRTSASVILIGTEADRSAAAALCSAFGDSRLMDTTGQWSLADLPALLAQLDCFVGVDSGATYIADAVGVPVFSAQEDIANVRLRFGSGCVANLTASRISRDRVRKLRFFQPAGYLSIDCAQQKVEGWRLTPGAGGVPAIVGGTVVDEHARTDDVHVTAPGKFFRRLERRIEGGHDRHRRLRP